MNVIFSSCDYCVGKIVFLSSIDNIATISDKIVYVDNRLMFDLKSWQEYKPQCILVEISTMFSHIVSYCISSNISVVVIKKDELINLNNAIVRIDYLQEQIYKTEYGISTMENLDNTCDSTTHLLPCNTVYTKDNHKVNLYATVKSIENAVQAKRLGVRNAGLVCTEFLYNRSANERLQISEKIETICSCFNKGVVSIRLFDCDPDKFFFDSPLEIDVGRGVRAIAAKQISEIIEYQIKCIVDISKRYRVSIVIPFITNYNDIEMVDNLVKKYNNGLSLPICAMIETPASFFAVPKLTNYVNSFSIGTNDLLASFFSCDRDSLSTGADYNTPYCWELLSFLHAYHKKALSKTRVCGQLPLYPLMIETLISLGFRSFSLPTPMINIIAKRISEISVVSSKMLFSSIENCTNEDEIVDRLKELFYSNHTSTII